MQLRECCSVLTGQGTVEVIVKFSNCYKGLNAEQSCFSQGQGMAWGTGHSQMAVGCNCTWFTSSCLTQPSNTVSPWFGHQHVQNSLVSCCKAWLTVAFSTTLYFGYLEEENQKTTSCGTHRPFCCRLNQKAEPALPQSIGEHLQNRKDSTYWCINIILYAEE